MRQRSADDAVLRAITGVYNAHTELVKMDGFNSAGFKAANGILQGCPLSMLVVSMVSTRHLRLVTEEENDRLSERSKGSKTTLRFCVCSDYHSSFCVTIFSKPSRCRTCQFFFFFSGGHDLAESGMISQSRMLHHATTCYPRMASMHSQQTPPNHGVIVAMAWQRLGKC